MTQPKVLVIDDEPAILNTVKAYLEDEGYAVRTALDGQSGLEAARAFHPDLIVLDILLPGIDGLELLRILRKESEVYVLMLTAMSEETDRIVGLTVGADDYLTKPFSPRELVARVKAILRRDRSTGPDEQILSFRRLRIDPGAHRVWVEGESIELTSTEFDLLLALARHHGRLVTREQLIEQVWGYDYYGDERLVDVHIGRMRKKLETDPADPSLIVTVRGAGYRFEDEPV